jgi:hypothetical protein
MTIVNVEQGSPEWHAFRAENYPASEAPAMMGCGLFNVKTPEELALVRLGVKKEEITDYQQMIFDRGHFAEFCARPIVEKLVGKRFANVTGYITDPRVSKGISASLDGMDMSGEVLFEHKIWNEKLAETIQKGKIEPGYYWQLEQQMLVSGAKEVVFVTSDAFVVAEGDSPENYPFYSEALINDEGYTYYTAATRLVMMVYKPVRGRAKKLIEGWAAYEAMIPQLLIDNPDWAQVATRFLSLDDRIIALQEELENLKSQQEPVKDLIVSVTKKLDSNLLIGSGIEVKKSVRKGAVSQDDIINALAEKLGKPDPTEDDLCELLNVDSLDFYRKPESESWKVKRVKGTIDQERIKELSQAMHERASDVFKAIPMHVTIGSFSF